MKTVITANLSMLRTDAQPEIKLALHVTNLDTSLAAKHAERKRSGPGQGESRTRSTRRSQMTRTMILLAVSTAGQESEDQPNGL